MHSQDAGLEDLLKRFYLIPGKYVKGPVFSKKAISDYGMELRMEPGVISNGMIFYVLLWFVPLNLFNTSGW